LAKARPALELRLNQILERIMNRRRILLAGSAALGLPASRALAQNQTGDGRLITLVVPFAPGGATDAIGRLIGRQVGEILGQPVVVENRPGAGGTIGIAHVARSAPQSRTLVLVNALQHTSSASLYPDLKYDVLNSFTPIATIGSLRYILVVHPGFPASRADEFVAEVRRNPGRYAYASAGVGSAPHLVMAYFASLYGLDMLHVPYKGSGPAMTDLAGNSVQAAMDNVAAIPLVKAGRLKALGISGEQRMAGLPEIATFAQSGAPGFSVAGTWGFLGPAGMPADAVNAIAGAVRQTLGSASVAEQLVAQGISPGFDSGVAFARILAQEHSRWRDLIGKLAIRL
jgi:tripartite-type tricarboxylate transporter receptor subunit TctC